MADNQELDKTIEELEAEVLGELEESSEINEEDTAPMKKGHGIRKARSSSK